MRPRRAPDPTPAAQRVGSRWWDAPGDLRGINLRSFLVLQLADAHGSLTIAELVDRAAASGMRVDGRTSKTISDALRWEVSAAAASSDWLVAPTASAGWPARPNIGCADGSVHAGGAPESSRVPATHDPAAFDGGVTVRAALELLASGDVVAQMRNRPATPRPDGRTTRVDRRRGGVRPGRPTRSTDLRLTKRLTKRPKSNPRVSDRARFVLVDEALQLQDPCESSRTMRAMQLRPQRVSAQSLTAGLTRSRKAARYGEI